MFDLDGTLSDPKWGIIHSMQYALRKMGRVEIPDEADLLWVIGPPLRENLAKILGTSDKSVIEKTVAYYHERFSVEGLFENEIYPGVPELLARLKQEGFILYLATSKPHVYARHILERFNLINYFEKVYGSEFDGTFSDKAQLLAHLLAEEGEKTANSIMIGDRMHDIRGARLNRLPSAGATYGYGSRQELIEAGADFLINRPVELLDFVFMEC